MNTVPPSQEVGQNDPENLAAAYREINGGEVLKQFNFEGAGDASLSPSHVHRHTPDASLGAVRGPAGAPVAHEGFTPPIVVIHGQKRILLSEAASRHLDTIGEDCFMIVTKAKTPDVVGRWVIHLVPCSMTTARDAESVLMGKARAVRIKTPRE